MDFNNGCYDTIEEQAIQEAFAEELFRYTEANEPDPEYDNV